MRKEIIINATLNEIRVAITEDGRLAELIWELPDKERHIGNIYYGRVQRIVQGMNAAFIDIGMKQDAFLHFSDVGESLEEDMDEDDDEEEETSPTLSSSENDTAAAVAKKPQKRPGPLPTFNTKRSGQVTINLEPSQMVCVQAVREAYANKGLRITTKVSLAGRYLVLLPFSSTIGVSKKIYNIRERRRLRRIAKSILPDTLGVIIRTEAQEKEDEVLKKDLLFLLEEWKKIDAQIKKAAGPTLLYRDMNVTQSLIRDLFTSDIDRVVIDSKKLFQEIKDYVEWAAPSLRDNVEYFPGPEPIFDAFNLEKDIEQSYSRKVDLPSGGSLVFDHTEAMVVIDVNSGRYAAEREQELNSLKTNMEALREIARQLRLRDIGGMIVVDFIDQQEERHKRKIYEEMKRYMSRDRAKWVIFPLSQLGLMQITRQRIRKNLLQVITEPCPTCEGRGTIQSKFMIINNIERWLRRFKGGSREFRLQLTVHPSVAQHLTDGRFSKLTRLMIKYFVKIDVRPSEYIEVDEFRFFSIRQNKEITREYQ